MKASLSHDLETGLPAADVWEVYGGLLLGQLIPQLLPTILSKVEVVDGDGGVGTVLHLTFPPGFRGLASQKEKFIKIDNENFVKEALVVEGGFLDLGFVKYLVRLEIIENADKTSIIRSTIEYEVGDEDTNTASLATTSTLASIAEAITKFQTIQSLVPKPKRFDKFLSQMQTSSKTTRQQECGIIDSVPFFLIQRQYHTQFDDTSEGMISIRYS